MKRFIGRLIEGAVMVVLKILTVLGLTMIGALTVLFYGLVIAIPWCLVIAFVYWLFF